MKYLRALEAVFRSPFLDLAEGLPESADRTLAEAISQGYRLGLIAAIEECEKTSEGLPRSMHDELLRLATRIRSRAKVVKFVETGKVPTWL